MYKYLIIKDGHTLTGFDDEIEAKNYASQHQAQIKENKLEVV